MADIITTPGKFQGERRYVPTLWSVVLDGGADETIDRGEDESPIAIIILTDEDRQAMGCADYAVALWETSDGFIRSRWFKSADAVDRAFAAADDRGEGDRTFLGELE